MNSRFIVFVSIQKRYTYDMEVIQYSQATFYNIQK